MAVAQTPIPPSTNFAVTGFLQEAKLGGPGTGLALSPALQGGSLKVNGQTIIVPSNTIVILPASAYTWQELFACAPAPYGNGFSSLSPTTCGAPVATPQTGLALNDLPAPLTTWEVSVAGNRVCANAAACGGPDDVLIAGLVDIHQNSLNSGAGFINFMNYATGEMRVGGRIILDGTGKPLNQLDGTNPGARVQISDPQGRFGRSMFVDGRFAVDDANPTIAAGSGFPMCFPRTLADPDVAGNADDLLCTRLNRPAATPPATGFASMIQTFDPATNFFPDARVQAPMKVGDYVAFAGTLVKDCAMSPTNCAAGQTGSIAGPYPTLLEGGSAATFVSAHTIGDNVAVYTWPGTNPAYVSIEVGLIGTGGLTVVGAGEAVIRSRWEGMTTDETRLIHLYGVDMNPADGTTSDRDFGTILPDPGAAAGGAVRGRWRFRPPCLPFGSAPSQKNCVMNAAGSFLPPPRETRAVIQGLQSQNPQNPLAITSANGIFYGQYHAPIGEYIFPENIPGTPIVENNFNTIPFLTLGGYSSSTGVFAPARLDPWPSNVVPSPACTPPTASTGGPYTAAASGTIPLNGSATGTGPFTFAWTTDVGTFSNPAIANPNFTAPASGVANLILTVTGSCGTAQASTTVSVSSPTAPTVGHVTPINTFSGASGTFVVSATDANAPAQLLTFTVTQTGAPALTVLTAGARICTGVSPETCTQTWNYTAPVLPLAQVTPTVITLTITATNTIPLTSNPAESTTITVNPTPDLVTLTAGGTEYRTGKQRLTIAASSSINDPAIRLTLQPYACQNVSGLPPCVGGTYNPDAAAGGVGAIFTNAGGGLHSITLVGVPAPACNLPSPPGSFATPCSSAPLVAKSNHGGTSAPHAIDKIRQ